MKNQVWLVAVSLVMSNVFVTHAMEERKEPRCGAPAVSSEPPEAIVRQYLRVRGGSIAELVDRVPDLDIRTLLLQTKDLMCLAIIQGRAVERDFFWLVHFCQSLGILEVKKRTKQRYATPMPTATTLYGKDDVLSPLFMDSLMPKVADRLIWLSKHEEDLCLEEHVEHQTPKARAAMPLHIEWAALCGCDTRPFCEGFQGSRDSLSSGQGSQ